MTPNLELRTDPRENRADQKTPPHVSNVLSRQLRTLPQVLVLALTLGMPVYSHAWGTQGHQVIALLAEQQLVPKAKQQVQRLLALEPGETLASISTWADEHRSPSTAAWHFVNFPKNSCAYEPQRDCPDGNCVIEATNKQLEVLASNAPDEKRLIALKYVVHLVADAHQPLHAGYLEDRGGNSYQIQAFGRGSNLHALWDTGLIKNMDMSNEMLAAKLRSTPVAQKDSELNMARAAEESCKIVGMPGFYPERKVGVDYVERYTPVLDQRLVMAGARLAGLLNRLFQ